MLQPIRSLFLAGAKLTQFLGRGVSLPFVIVFLFFFLPNDCRGELPALKIRIIGEFNQKGLSRDIRILTDEISSLGYIVEAVDFHRLKKKKPNDPAIEVADIQIVIQDFSEKNMKRCGRASAPA